MHGQFSTLTLFLLLCSLSTFVLALKVWRRRAFVGAKFATWLLVSTTIWCFAYAYEASVNMSITLLLTRNIRFVCSVSAALCWFYYVLQLTGRHRWVMTSRALVFLAIPVLLLLGAWTNEFHHLVWDDVHRMTPGGSSLPISGTGLLYWLNPYYALALLTLGTTIVLRVYRVSSGDERKQYLFVLVSGVFPLADSLLLLSGLFGIDPIPFAFSASGIAIATGILLYQRIDVVPVAKEVILQKIADPIIVLDGQDRIVDTNEAAKAILGGSNLDLTGAPVHRFLPSFDASGDSKEFKLALKTGTGTENRAFESHIARISRKGKREGKVLYLHDITKRKVLEDELRRERDRFVQHVTERTFELSQSNAALIEEIKERERQNALHKRLEARLMQTQKMEALGTLAGGIAHDFNNILWVIMGNTEMSLRRLSRGDAIEARLEEILVACQRAKSMINQILTFSRQEEQERQSVKPDQIVHEAVELFKTALPSKISMTCRIEPGCGTVMADPAKLHQVLMNLFTNAIHAMEQTGGILEVRLRSMNLNDHTASFYPELKRDQTYMDLTISDTGCGMDRKTLDRIFDPFFTTKPAGKGTGMGLATAHGIISSLEGLIDVISKPDVGTMFRIFVPTVEE